MFRLIQNFLAAIGKGEYPATMPEDMRRSFERWYREQTRGAGGRGGLSPGSPAPETGKENRIDPGGFGGTPFPGYPALRGELNNAHFSRTRIRTSFDPDLEIPRLQGWFEQNQHPSRDQMIFYLNELNSLESRRGRKPLDLTNIIYWFKNARAAQRRAHRGGTPEAEAEAPEHETEMDESLTEERMSPVDAVKVKREPASQQPELNNQSTATSENDSENVPVLPNRNAVYVVNEPLHMYKQEDTETESNVLHIEPEEPAEQRTASPQPDNNNSNKGGATVDVSGSGRDGDASADRLHEPKHSPRETNSDSGNGSDADPAPGGGGGAPRSPAMELPQNLSVAPGTKRSSESLDSDISEDEMDDSAVYNGHYGRYRSNGSENGGSDSPSGSSGTGLSPLSHGQGALIPGHPLFGSPGPHHPAHGQPPPAHQQSLQLHPHHTPHLPHPLNMHLFPHPLYNPIDASALMGGAPKSYKDAPSPTSLSEDHRKKRSRVFIDPLTEIPKLEKWFLEDTHPSSYMIEKYTEDLNRSEYRQRFPKLEPKNVQLWFKNHRAKVKRQRFEHSAELIQQQQQQQDGVVHSGVASEVLSGGGGAP